MELSLVPLVHILIARAQLRLHERDAADNAAWVAVGNAHQCATKALPERNMGSSLTLEKDGRKQWSCP
jgi:hypothetical protein